jgi:hypothetical protein
MISVALLLIAAIPIHVLWLRKRRLALMPPIGSKWVYCSYVSAYKAEVIEHHPFTGEVTLVRIRLNDPLEVRTTVNVNAKNFLASAKPLREK